MKYLRFLIAASAVVCAWESSADTAPQELPVVATIARSGDFLGFGFESIWMMSGAKLARVNPADNSVKDIPVKGSLGRLRAFQIGERAVWLPDIAADLLFKVDPTSNSVVLSVPIPMERGEASIGVGLGSVWVMADGADPHSLLRLDEETGVEQAQIVLPGDGAGVFVAFGSVWVTAPVSKQLYQIDPATNAVARTIEMASQPRFLAADEHSVWIVELDGYLQRVDGKTGQILATIATGLEGAGDIDAGGGYVWITTHGLALLQVDPKTNSVVARYHSDEVGDSVRYGAGSIWISGPAIYRVSVPSP